MTTEWKVRIKAGELAHKVELQSLSSVSDGQGGFTESWTTEDTLHAAVAPLSAQEVYWAGQQDGGETHKITVRYNASITNKKRFLFGTRVLNLTSVRNILERNRKMVCFAVEQL